MPKLRKKQVRDKFRQDVIGRAAWKCEVCEVEGRCRQTGDGPGEVMLDVHHIIPRDMIKGGGYVKENGICLCGTCHQKAEDGEISQERCFTIICSSVPKARQAAREAARQ